MPIYEYQCQKCGQMHSIVYPQQSKPGKCDKCKGPVEKVMSVTGRPVIK